MVENQIENRGISNKSVLEAMRRVPRHLFVPEDQRENAYTDNALPIKHNQTISQPYIVGFMTEAIDPRPGDKVLEIGTGSGYQAAVLAEIVGWVYSIEIIPALGKDADILLKDLGYGNVSIKIADGYYGWKEEAPFDAIVVTAAAPEIPTLLFDQLAEGGRLIIPIGRDFSIQHLMLVKKKNGKMHRTQLFPVRFVPFTGDH